MIRSLLALITPTPRGNSLRVIYPYWCGGTWVFDDDRVGLDREPFVAGADAIITACVEHIPDAKDGFMLTFSDAPFPGSTLRLIRGKEEHGGYWYSTEDGLAEGWLCPATCHYFNGHPKEIHAQFSPAEETP